MPLQRLACCWHWPVARVSQRAPPLVLAPLDVMDSGERMLADGRPAQAVALYREAAIAAPRDPRPRVKLSEALIEVGREDEARAAIAEALAIDPGNEEATAAQSALDAMPTRPKPPQPMPAAPPPLAPLPVAPPPVALLKPTPAGQPAERPAASPPPMAASDDPPGSTWAQVGAFASPAEAEQAWVIMQPRLAQHLGGAHQLYSRARVGERNWVRLRVGPFDTAGAGRFCAAVKAGGGACFIAPKTPVAARS